MSEIRFQDMTNEQRCKLVLAALIVRVGGKLGFELPEAEILEVTRRKMYPCVFVNENGSFRCMALTLEQVKEMLHARTN